ncbi:MAG: DNA polymerase/3'-5' exonuclease PolX [Thermoguttaceae bacterium]|jgi:DNA polymerase (family 10)
MTNVEIAAVFEHIADLLEFQDANPFRVRAYRNAARTIHDLPESAAEILSDPNRSLTDIEGIGKDLAEKITTLVQTGSLPMLDELLAEIPQSVMAILRVPGLGPKRAAVLFHELNVANIDQLREACQQHRVRELKGFGAKSEEAILQGLDIAAEAGRRMLWADADQHVQSILSHMDSCRAIEKIEAAGSYRRCKDTVGDLDFLAVAQNTNAVMDHLTHYGGLAQVLARGDTKMSIRLTGGVQVDLRVVPEISFGAALQYFTGSKQHNIVLRGRAKDQGLKINEYGVFRGDQMIAGRTEEDVYAALGLPCIPPELREARREFEWADAGTLPELVELGDIRGDLHTHSTWTDGLATIEEMAQAAKQRGLKYIAVTDHSQRVAMVNGLNPDRVLQQWTEIDKLKKRLKGITVLKGIEVDILERGGLDLPDDVLAQADWVVASVHYGHNQPKEQITRRMIEALENPYVCAIAHPTGRMLLRRKPYEVDLDAVLRAACDNGKFMELNAHPMRLDLDDVACAAAKNLGVPIVISTDAHRTDGLDAMRYGIMQARRGGLTKHDVANTHTWPQVKKMLGK